MTIKAQTDSDQSDCGYRSKVYGYNKGCRCERCLEAGRAARRASMKRTGGNIRIGRRAESKRRSDYTPCPQCGLPKHRQAHICLRCRKANRQAFEERIRALRHEGFDNTGIARLEGVSVSAVANAFAQMRRQGVDVGYSPWLRKGRVG